MVQVVDRGDGTSCGTSYGDGTSVVQMDLSLSIRFGLMP